MIPCVDMPVMTCIPWSSLAIEMLDGDGVSKELADPLEMKRQSAFPTFLRSEPRSHSRGLRAMGEEIRAAMLAPLARPQDVTRGNWSCPTPNSSRSPTLHRRLRSSGMRSSKPTSPADIAAMRMSPTGSRARRGNLSATMRRAGARGPCRRIPPAAPFGSHIGRPCRRRQQVEA